MPKVSVAYMEARRDQILTAALTCFAEKGFHACTMQDICQTAGLSPGAVYRYFESKDQIIESLSAQVKHHTQELFDRARSENQIKSATLKMIDVLFSSPDDNEELLLRVELMLESEALNNEKLRFVLLEQFQHLKSNLISMLSTGKSAGEIKADIDIEYLVESLLALHHGFKVILGVHGSTNIEKYKNTVRQILDGIWIKDQGA